jgi:prohibitin 2
VDLPSGESDPIAALVQSNNVLELRRIQVEQTKAQRGNGQLPSAIYAGAPIPFLNAKLYGR